MKRSFIIVVLLVVVLLGGGWLFLKDAEPSEEETVIATTKDTSSSIAPQEDAQYYYGIDVSHWNGNVLEDIKKIDGLSFGICKATQGEMYLDPYFHTNWKLLQQKGLIRGAYHFYSASDEPTKQAVYYYNIVGAATDKMQMTYIVDIEAGSLSRGVTANVGTQLLTFLKELQKLSGKVPMVYTNYAFANEYLTNPELAKYPLWLAEYSGGETPQLPTVWKEKGCTIWQKSDRYNLDNTKVDYDQYHGIRSDLNVFGE